MWIDTTNSSSSKNTNSRHLDVSFFLPTYELREFFGAELLAEIFNPDAQREGNDGLIVRMANLLEMKRLNGDPSAAAIIIWWLYVTVFDGEPKRGLVLFKKQVVRNAYDLVNMSDKVNGFSGTPRDEKTVDRGRLALDLNSEIEKEIADAISKRSDSFVTKKWDPAGALANTGVSQTPADLFSELFEGVSNLALTKEKKANGKKNDKQQQPKLKTKIIKKPELGRIAWDRYSSFIDAAAEFKNFSGSQVACELLMNFPSKKAVAFYADAKPGQTQLALYEKSTLLKAGVVYYRRGDEDEKSTDDVNPDHRSPLSLNINESVIVTKDLNADFNIRGTRGRKFLIPLRCHEDVGVLVEPLYILGSNPKTIGSKLSKQTLDMGKKSWLNDLRKILINYYDQSHVIGSDLPNPLLGYAFQTTGTTVVKDLVSQGVMRMRQFIEPPTQHVDFVVTKRAAEVMKIALIKLQFVEPQETLTSSHLFEYARNLQREEEKMNYYFSFSARFRYATSDELRKIRDGRFREGKWHEALLLHEIFRTHLLTVVDVEENLLAESDDRDDKDVHFCYYAL